MIPQSLNEWTIDTVSTLVIKGVFEDEIYDLKEMLPHSRNSDEKERLRKSCAAFANSSGGFLVFGVKDSKQLTPSERIVGLPLSFDFPEHFGVYAQTCTPSVEWEFKNPALSLPSGNVIHVVWIPRSWKAPHAVSTGDGAWIFPKRTNKGNESMSIEEIRYSFLGLYEKRLKLQLLRAEVMAIDENAKEMLQIDQQANGATYSLISFDTAILDSVIADTYSITSGYVAFHKDVQKLRQLSRIANNKIRMLFSIAVMPLSNQTASIQQHNMSMRPFLSDIRNCCQRILVELDRMLGA
jgi:predicted HTH transcriptional regulator